MYGKPMTEAEVLKMMRDIAGGETVLRVPSQFCGTGALLDTLLDETGEPTPDDTADRDIDGNKVADLAGQYTAAELRELADWLDKAK